MNLLFINADQLRHDCVGYAGVRPVATPHLDRLAATGAAFTRAFAPLPVCAPARQAFLCGRHPDSFGAQWNYDFMPTPELNPDWCWTTALPGLGYNTAYLGRFHVSPTRKPADFGYRQFVDWSGHKRLIAEKYPALSHSGGWLGEKSPVALSDSGTHWMADRVAETIREFAAAGRPWHIWADYEEPHLPCRPSAPFADMYDPASIEPWDGFDDPFVNKPYCHRQQAVNWQLDGARWADVAPMVARYYGVISQLDDAIGKILAALEETGQAGNTIVAFTSDHGDMCGSHRMLDKHYVLYDDIVRVPLIVRHPDYAPWRCDSFQSNALDLPASFVRWLSLPDPGGMHGAPLPRSAAEDENPRACITSSGNGQQMGLHSIRMLRDDRCKYVWNLTDVDELYDLTDDPGELNNLIARPDLAGRVADMRRALYADLQAHGDRLVGNEWTRRQLLDNRKLPAR